MGILIILLAGIWLIKSGPADLAHAIRGTTSPRHTERMAKLAAAEKRAEARAKKHGYERPRRGRSATTSTTCGRTPGSA
ncbi:hypothetical protein ACFQXA_38790 [Nocardiopsis composta]